MTLDFGDGAACGVNRARDGDGKSDAFEDGSDSRAGATIGLGVAAGNGEPTDGTRGPRAGVATAGELMQRWCQQAMKAPL